MKRVVVDTDVVSYTTKSDSRFDAYAPELDGKQLEISFMTMAELLLWQDLRQWGTVRRQTFMNELHRRYVYYPVHQELCQHWAEITAEAKRQGNPIETADAWIAATAKLLNVPLVTHNVRDFRHIPDLQLVTFSSN